MAASSSRTRMRELVMGDWPLRILPVVDPQRLELPLAGIGRIEVQREDLAGAGRAGRSPIIRNGGDGFAIQLEQHVAALNARFGCAAERLDAGDEHAARRGW